MMMAMGGSAHNGGFTISEAGSSGSGGGGGAGGGGAGGGGGGGGSVRGEASRRCVSVNDIRRAFEKAEQSLASSVKGGPGSGSGSSGAGSGISPSHNRMSSLDSTASDESSIPTPSGSHNYYGSVSSLVSGRENLKDHYGSITSLASSTSLISPQVHLHSNLDNKGRPSTIYVLSICRSFRV